VPSSDSVVVDDLLDLVRLERPRLHIRLAALIGVSMPGSCGCRGRYALGTAEIVRVHKATHVLKLCDDAAARRVDRMYHWLPAVYLLCGPKSRSARPA
jgi:hypothetical protein